MRGGGRQGRGGGRSGRDEGRAGKTKEKKNKPSGPIDNLPDYLKAFSTGWTEITKENHPYTIVDKDDYNTFENGKHLSEMYVRMADSVTSTLSKKGLPVTSHNILSHLLSDIALLKIIEYTNEELVIMGHPITNLTEFKQFIGTRWLRSRLRVSPTLAFAKMKETAKFNGFLLMDISRYNNIYACIRGFSMKGRHKDFNDEVTWMRHGALLRNLAPLEQELFVRSVETLLNRKDCNLVIDDELIGSRAKDVESKSLSHRKAGKEGPTSDAIACSFTSVLFGVRLRVRGETLENNVHNLIDTLPKITSEDENIRLTFDRGYGTMRFISKAVEKKFNISTIGTTIGS